MNELAHKHILSALKTRINKPMLVREIMRLLKLTTDDRHLLKLALNELMLSGEIVKTRGNRYGISEKMDLEVGIFQAHPNGFGFVLSEKKGKGDKKKTKEKAPVEAKRRASGTLRDLFGKDSTKEKDKVESTPPRRTSQSNLTPALASGGGGSTVSPVR